MTPRLSRLTMLHPYVVAANAITLATPRDGASVISANGSTGERRKHAGQRLRRMLHPTVPTRGPTRWKGPDMADVTPLLPSTQTFGSAAQVLTAS